jgi:peroxiredoxin
MASNSDTDCDPDSDPEIKERKMLNIGCPAPRFTAHTQDGRIIRSDDFIGRKNVVLYFFSREGTPG